MNLLFIGGTKFVGRHAAEAALARGHRVTLLHRGQTGSGAIGGAQEILLDRMADLSEVASQKWDAVIDSCGYVPRVVRHSAEAFKNSTNQYLFISTISVYSTGDGGQLTVKGQAPLDTEEVTGETYGPLKVESEAVVNEVFGERACILRPGLLAGPYDPTNRFTYWVTRVAEGGDVLVTDGPEQPLQLIDARDLGEFQIKAVEDGLRGVYDVAGEPITFGEMLTVLTQRGALPRFVPAPPDVLAKADVALWKDLPLTFAQGEGLEGLMGVDSGKAIAAGLRRRPLAETARDTLRWALDHPAENPTHGLSRERETAVLKEL
jgi:2'-hydroxyisoflavone reductase